MQVLFIRHAPAGKRSKHAAEGGNDSERPLTPAGRWKMKKAARGLSRLIKSPDIITTSPLARASQTARIVCDALGGPRLIELSELKPGSAPKDLLDRLKGFGRTPFMVLVGHEPHLSACVDYATTGGKGLRLELKKGACCLLRFDDKPAAGTGTLLWSLTPSQLRKLAP
jgi:phosphohistidine phosphatase